MISFIEAGEKAKIKDVVEYCVTPNLDFTVKGILMDKSTGEPLLINGETVESSVELNSEDECGSIEMFFEFDASDLGGRDLVVFERLYFGEDLIESHDDIDDAEQTVSVISLRTFVKNRKTAKKTLSLNEDVEVEDAVSYC